MALTADLSPATTELSPTDFVETQAASTSSYRICVISEAFSGGVGRFVTGMAVELARRGHEIVVVYSPVRQDLEYLSFLERAPGVELRPVKMTRAIGFSDIGSLNEIVQILKKDGPFDIIHGQSSKGGGYARLAGLMTGIPVVYSPHAFITLSPLLSWRKKVAYSMLERVLALGTSRIFCCSQSEYEHARKLGIAEKRLAVVPNGLTLGPTPTRTELREKYGFKPDDIIAGFVGRMEEQKAPDRFIEAAVRLFPEVPNLKFVLIGDGPKRKPLQELLQNIPGGDRVHWLGNIDARPVFPLFDMFVMTSLYEGFPFALLEALWAGLPIISTPVGGTEEMIELGFNGLIVPQGSQSRLVEAIKSLSLNPSIRRQLGEASRQKAERFTFTHSCDLIEQYYRESAGREDATESKLAQA